ncbi:hypothetical protein BDV93DRAFT_560999 [Ceratobasidium sp. AG-I]|nr:hypothetical protein BDV93DRAFT_560999 [Ceratobasidium sp. AG-I]
MTYEAQEKTELVEELRRHLQELKEVFSREIDNYTAQKAATDEPQRSLIQAEQSILKPEDDQLVDQPHISTHVQEDKTCNSHSLFHFPTNKQTLVTLDKPLPLMYSLALPALTAHPFAFDPRDSAQQPHTMLMYGWDDGSWIVDLVFNTLTESASNEMRNITADFLFYNSESVSRHLQVYNILYEMLRMHRHESLSYFDYYNCGYLRNVTKSFHSIAMANSNECENMQGAIDALLDQLANNNLLGTLILSAYGSDWQHLCGGNWHGLQCGETTIFWGERIIALAQRSNGQQASSDDPGPPTVADRIREFCLESSELPNEAEASDEHRQEIAMNIMKSRQKRFVEGYRNYLPELKKVLLREIGGYTVQPAPTNEPQQPSIPVVQPIKQPQGDQPVDHSHTSIHSREREAIGDILTPGTNT